MPGESKKNATRSVATNRKASFAYHILEKFEAGIVLTGTEVKSLRTGHAGLAECFGRVKNGEIFLHGMHIPPYEAGNIRNHDPYRERKILLHRRQMTQLAAKVRERGFTLVPLSVYFKDGFAKVEIALAKGKSHFDKREAIRGRAAKEEAARELGTRRER
ncbi:MAG: SsrA-binding protein SmpB [Planctomycetota bacterium]